MRRAIPWAMIWLRVALCPVIVAGARLGWAGPWLGAIVLVALVDDIFDGILARRWGTETEALRRADSAADTIFYLGVAVAFALRQMAVLRANWTLLLALGVLELVRHGFDRRKFGRAAAYHSYLAKLWGLVMGTAVTAQLGFGGPQWLLPVSFVLGILSNAEGLTMSVVLPRWAHDVTTIAAARRLRGEMLAQPAPGESEADG